MSRPAQLEQQIEHVKKLQAEMLEGDKPDTDKDQNTDIDTNTQPTEPITAPVIVETPVTISKEEYDRLEQRHRTLQGMYNADVNRLRGEMNNQATAIQDLENRLVAAEQANKTAPTPPTKYVTKEDEDEFGNTIDMVRRAAREEAEAVARTQEQAYLNRIAQLEQQLGHVQNTVVPRVEDLSRSRVEQTKAEFWAAIDTQVPDWRTINDDQKFKDWLLAVDPVTGATRQQFLTQARNEYNASRVVKFFEEWKRSAAGGQTPAPRNTAQTELEKLVAPGASKGGSTPNSQDKKQWTNADVKQFYADVTKGVYHNREAERIKIQEDIFAAQRENRFNFER